MITSASNQQIKTITALLKKSRERNSAGVFVVEGRKMFEEAMSLNLVEKAYFSESYVGKYGEISEVDHEVVSDSVFNSIAETVTPQGVIALVKMQRADADELIENAKKLVLLECLQDPGNLGTILRTAEAAGMDGVIVSDDTVDVYNPKVVRSTMGAIFRVPVAVSDNLKETVKSLISRHYRVFATSLKAENTYDKADYTGRSAVLIGNEGNGLTDEITDLATDRVIIPMEGKAESLNAAVAAALMMFEMKRGDSV